MKLLVGLGNPGLKYSKTRHNIGFMIMENLAARLQVNLNLKKNSLIGKGHIGGEDVILAQPQTFMNLSGEAVRPVFSYQEDLEIEDLVVIHDDLDLDFSRIKIKLGGGHGGHNGIKSITSHLSGNGFARVRIGIGRPQPGQDVSSYVLSPFSAEEKKGLDELIDKATDAVEMIVKEGIIKAMNRFNS